MRLNIGSRVRIWLKVSPLLLAMLMACGGPPPSAERVGFRSEDGFALDGRLFGEGPRGVVLAHMYPADQSSWYEYADVLGRQGFLVLTFDFRGYGKSEGRKDVSLMDRDVRAAVRFIRSQGARKVVVVGASMGGTAGLVAAGRAEVAGVATLSAPLEFRGLDAAKAVPKVSAPKLFMSSLEDPSGATEAATVLLKADPTAEIQILAGSEHGTDMLKGTSGEEVRKLLGGFIARVTR